MDKKTKVWYRLLGGWHETFICGIERGTGRILLNNGAMVSIRDINDRWTLYNPYGKEFHRYEKRK